MKAIAPAQDKLPELAGATDVGCVRERNEDAIAWDVHPQYPATIAVLTDGMGGHKGGERASQLTIDSILEYARSWTFAEYPKDIEAWLPMMSGCAEAANHRVRVERQQDTELANMGATLVFVVAWQQKLAVLHAGDSRCYHAQAGEGNQAQSSAPLALTQLTRDDSVVQSMLDEGLIHSSDIPNIPYRNTLTNAIGIRDQLEYRLTTLAVDAGDVALLCSDGFHNVVMPEVIARALSASAPLDEVAKHLVALSLEQHTDDNTSVIVMRFY